MARTVRSRLIPAPREAVWEVLSDPHHLPRWWPQVTRVEHVQGERFTEVVPTKRGKPMRLDLRVTASTAPELRSWAQELAGTPFERLLDEWTTSVSLAEQDGATLVTITEVQQLRGSFRLGLPLQRRPARRRVDAALAGLAALF